MYPTLNGLVGRLNHLGHDYVDIKVADISIGLKVYVDRNGTYKDHTITKINPDGTYNICNWQNSNDPTMPLAKLKQKVIHILPSLLLIEDGVHDDGEVININIPISIIGESREHCIVIGGLLMKGKKEDDVNVSHLTLRDSKVSGVYGYKGASMHLDNVSVENSGNNGVSVSWTKRNSMKNCNVSHSKGSGLLVASRGLMTIDGNATTIHHNCTGLKPIDSSASIHIVSPLTIEMISKNNGGDGNYDGCGTIQTIANNTKKVIRFRQQLRTWYQKRMVLWDESDEESTIKLLQKHSTKDGYELFLRNAVETKWIVQTTKGIEKLWEDL